MLPGNIHRNLLVLSLVNWGIAVVCWAISAWLGISRPTSIFVYTILFVIGLVAVVVAIVAFVLADFGTAPSGAAPDPAGSSAGDAPQPVADHCV